MPEVELRVGDMLLVLSNAASAVLVAPTAICAAVAIGISPYPFAVAILMAAFSSYPTPVSTPVVTLVVESGRYRFSIFVEVGVPLVLTYLVILIVASMILMLYQS